MRGARIEFYLLTEVGPYIVTRAARFLICGLSNGAFIGTTYSSVNLDSPLPNAPSRNDPIIVQLPDPSKNSSIRLWQGMGRLTHARHPPAPPQFRQRSRAYSNIRRSVPWRQTPLPPGVSISISVSCAPMPSIASPRSRSTHRRREMQGARLGLFAMTLRRQGPGGHGGPGALRDKLRPYSFAAARIWIAKRLRIMGLR